MGRYKIAVIDINNNKTYLRFKVNGSYTEHLPLVLIDRFTVKSKDVEDLKRRLYEISGNDLGKIFDIKITYEYNGETRTVPLAFSDKEFLGLMKMETESEISLNSVYFVSKMSEFIKLIDKEGSFYTYLMSSNKLLEKQKEYIEKRVFQKDYSVFSEQKLRSHCSKYRQFRDILFLIDDYKNRFAKKQDDFENEEEYKSRGNYNFKDDCYFDDEEIRKYDESLEKNIIKEDDSYSNIVKHL